MFLDPFQLMIRIWRQPVPLSRFTTCVPEAKTVGIWTRLGICWTASSIQARAKASSDPGENIEGHDVQANQGSSVDLLANMAHADWLAKMKICGQTEHVWAALVHARGSGDDVSLYSMRVADWQVVDAVCILALYVIVVSGDGLDVVIRSDGDYCVAFVLSQLALRQGILDAASTVKQTPLVSERSPTLG